MNTQSNTAQAHIQSSDTGPVDSRKDAPNGTDVVKRKRGRPALIDAKLVCETALSMGVSTITMTSVAARLGVNHATLYRYVTGRTDLVKQAIDVALSRTEFPPDEGSWKDYLNASALAVAEMLTAYPGVATELASGTFPHSVFTKTSEIMSVLMKRGFDADDALLAVDLVMFLVIDHCRRVEQMDHLVAAPAMPSREQFVEEWPKDNEVPAASAEVSEKIAEVGRAAINSDSAKRLRRKLSIAMAGIASEVAPLDA